MTPIGILSSLFKKTKNIQYSVLKNKKKLLGPRSMGFFIYFILRYLNHPLLLFLLVWRRNTFVHFHIKIGYMVKISKYGLVTGRNILWGSRSCFTE
ncbi:hypothetical protein COJ36_07140 [Priestia megaterium]|nr:hypothetical protein COJ36_07140 [Priestia megaterium]